MTRADELGEPHRQYATRPADQRFETMDALQAAIEARTQSARERTIPFESLDIREAAWGENAAPILNGGADQARFTNWSFGQLCTRVGAPAGFLRNLSPSTAALALREAARQAADRKDMVKLLVADDESDLDGPTGGKLVRAITSKEYGRIWDRDVVIATRRLLDASGDRFQNPLVWEKNEDGSHKRGGLYASDRDVFAFFIDGGSIVEEKGDREGALHRGFYVSNSETGSATLRLVSFLFRQCCGNHIIMGGRDVRSLSVRHTSGAPGRFLSEVAPAILDMAQASASGEEEAIRKAQNYMLPAEVEARDEFLFSNGFTRAETRSAIEHAEKEEGGAQTLWQVVNGFTARARDLAHIDARTDLERRAGKLLALAS